MEYLKVYITEADLPKVLEVLSPMVLAVPGDDPSLLPVELKQPVICIQMGNVGRE